MPKKTPIEKLQESIDKILSEYADSVTKSTNEVAEKLARKGAQAVRQNVRGMGWGKNTNYDKGWTATIERKRLGTVATVHNQSAPGLAHLLEKGHALRGGGRSHTDAFPHIAPVEEELVDAFEKAVKDAI